MEDLSHTRNRMEQKKRPLFLPQQLQKDRLFPRNTKSDQLSEREKRDEQRVEANISIFAQAMNDDRLDVHDKVCIPVVKNRDTGAVEGFFISEGTKSGVTYAVAIHHLRRISVYCDDMKVAAAFNVSEACPPTPFPEDLDY